MIGLVGGARGIGGAGLAGVVDPLAAGTIIATATDETTIVITEAAGASGGHGTITVAIYRHTATFTPPGTGTLVGTSLPVTDTGRTAGVTYFYEAIYTDAVLATDHSSEVSAVTEEEEVDPGAPDLVEDWDYASTSEMQVTDPNNWFDPDDVSAESIAAGDTLTLVTGIMDAPWNMGVASKAMRTTYHSRASTGGESMYGKNLNWNRVGLLGTPNEIWVRQWMRFMSGWKTDFTVDGGAKGQADHKTLFFAHNAHTGGGGRWEEKWGWGNAIRIQIEAITGMSANELVARVSPVCSPSNTTGTPVNPNAGLFNGAWWEVYTHAKHETSIGANDGAYEVWIAGLKVFEALNVGTGRNLTTGGFTGLTLGRNLNHYPKQTQWFEFGKIEVYTTNPLLH